MDFSRNNEGRKEVTWKKGTANSESHTQWKYPSEKKGGGDQNILR